MLLKDPSWSSLAPELPTFQVPDDAIANELRHASKLDGEICGLGFDTSENKHYLIKTSSESLCIKLVAAEHLEHQQRSEDIVRWLDSQVDVVCAAEQRGIVNISGKEYTLFTSPYIIGRRLEANEHDVITLAKAIAHLHSVLKTYPAIDTIEKKTRLRYQLLEDIRTELAEEKISGLAITNDVIALANEMNLLDTQYLSQCQLLHGDLNPGNILLQEDARICFFDFEDILHSYLPPILELAYVIERIILLHVKNDREAILLGQKFINSYKDNGGDYCYQETDNKVIRVLCLRAFCTLIHLSRAGGLDIETEWQKFLYLLKLSNSRQSVFEAMLSREKI